MNIPKFRADFPEFADQTVYPTPMITFWAGLAEKLVAQDRYGDCWSQAVNLYVAHEIVIAAQNKRLGVSGGAPGTFGGTPNTKTVGGATIGYDASSSSEKDAGYWNMTAYGKQFFRLMKIFGAGCVQL